MPPRRPAGPPEVRNFTVTTPAGTAKATPLVTSLTMPPRRVARVHWRVPTGPMGSLGWRLTMGGVQVLPTSGGDAWVIASGESGAWVVQDLPDSGAWQLTSYNTGSNPHAVYLEFTLDVLGQDAPDPLPPWPLIYSAGLGAS
jgi:hypothetical protein